MARLSLTVEDVGEVRAVSLDDVVGMETFRTAVNPAETLIASTLATAAVVGGSLLAPPQTRLRLRDLGVR